MSNGLSEQPPAEKAAPVPQVPAVVGAVLIALLLALMYWRSSRLMYGNWTLIDSYYSHGFLILPISLFLAWRKRREILKTPVAPTFWGYPFVLGAVALLLAGDFFGFSVFGQLSIVPMLVGLCLVLLGKGHFKILWFPLAFLLFMIPIPASMTQSIALNLKLFATECAVLAAQALTLPIIREGSFVHFGNDHLLIGEVCGGLRSLIALFAIGALMAYFSKSRLWARFLILVCSGPIAVIANVFRILTLCVVGYFWGSRVAAGTFHDVSGLFIFAVAFFLFFCLEALVRRLAPASPSTDSASQSTGGPS